MEETRYEKYEEIFDNYTLDINECRIEIVIQTTNKSQPLHYIAKVLVVMCSKGPNKIRLMYSTYKRFTLK